MQKDIIKKIMKKVSLLFMLLALPTIMVLAQDEDPPPPGDGGGGDPGVPIDGGISLLAAAGIAYGAKVVHARRKAKQAEKTPAVEV